MRHRVFSISRATLAVCGALLCSVAEAVTTPAIGEAPPDPPERLAARSDTIVYRVSPLRPRDAVFVYSLGASRGTAASRQADPGTARELGVARPFSVEDNVDGGVRYLRWMLDRYRGETDRALAAYNAGPGAVDAHGGVPPYAETQRYVRRVRALHRSYQHAFAP